MTRRLLRWQACQISELASLLFMMAGVTGMVAVSVASLHIGPVIWVPVLTVTGIIFLNWVLTEWQRMVIAEEHREQVLREQYREHYHYLR